MGRYDGLTTEELRERRRDLGTLPWSPDVAHEYGRLTAEIQEREARQHAVR